MEWLKSETDLAPLHSLVFLRPLLPRGRFQLQQIKRELENVWTSREKEFANVKG